MKNVNYNDLALSTSFACCFFETDYANEAVGLSSGRWELSYNSTLDSLNIAYQELSLNDLLSSNTFDDILISVPKELIEFNSKIKSEVVQFFPVYSTYMIASIDSNWIELKLMLTEKKSKTYKIKVSDFVKLSSLTVRPLYYPYKIYKLTTPEQLIDKQLVYHSLKSNLTKCVESTQTFRYNMTAIQGFESFDKIVEFVENWESKRPLIRHMFVVSFLVGSTTCFRKEWLEALKCDKLLVRHNLAKLEHVAKLWSGLTRILRNANDVNVEVITEKIMRIKGAEQEMVLDMISNIGV